MKRSRCQDFVCLMNLEKGLYLFKLMNLLYFQTEQGKACVLKTEIGMWNNPETFFMYRSILTVILMDIKLNIKLLNFVF